MLIASRTVPNGSSHIPMHRPGSSGIIRRPPTPSPMAAITAEIDGVRLSSLWESGDVSRTTTFELLKIARIEPESRRIPGSQRPVAFLNPDQERMMRALIDRLRDGATLAQLRSEAAVAIERVESRTIPDDPPPSEASAEALDLAIATGAPLATADVRALLLVNPGAPVVQRGKLQARRLGRNHWVIEAID